MDSIFKQLLKFYPTNLDLSGKNLGGEGIKALAEVLKGNQTLTTLNLSKTNIKPKDTVEIAKILTQTQLTTLNLSGNQIGDIFGGQNLYDEASITATVNLYRSLGTNFGLTPIAEALKVNSTLTSLNLAGNQIIDDGIARLSKALSFDQNQTLTSLDLSNNNFGIEGLTALVGAIAQPLKPNKTLTTLHLAGNKLGDEAIGMLSKALSYNRSLTTLNLSDNQIGAVGARSLATYLRYNHNLLHLYLAHNLIDRYGAKHLASALKDNRRLITLNLLVNPISDFGVMDLADALEHNSTLKSLNLAFGQFGHRGPVKLARALEQNRGLTELDLSDNYLGDWTAYAFEKVLKNNTTLAKLYLKFAELGSDGITDIAESLKENTTLTVLNLAGNQVESEAAEALIEALKENTTLTVLDLRLNSIDEEVLMKLSWIAFNRPNLEIRVDEPQKRLEMYLPALKVFQDIYEDPSSDSSLEILFHQFSLEQNFKVDWGEEKFDSFKEAVQVFLEDNPEFEEPWNRFIQMNYFTRLPTEIVIKIVAEMFEVNEKVFQKYLIATGLMEI